ncbi:MAG: glycosyltransferase family 2 protein [Verrucomicrobiota bacterium]|nr:glycosyltransferase family 2 protein [Verrucomicrobiota bacterium]
MTASPKSLTIGVPCFNEALTVGKVVDGFRAVFPLARILVIDNASSDETAKVAREHGAEVISEPRRGKGYAVQRLFCECNSDHLIMVDGDDTYPAEEAPKLIAALESQGGDTVVGRRVSSEQAAFKAAHTWANQALAQLIEAIFRTPCGDLFSGYRLFTRAFYRNVPMLATGFEVETELSIQTIDKGFVQRDADINFRSRPEGSFSKLSTFRDGFRVLRVIVTVVKDFKPLLFFSVIAALFFVASIAVGIFPILDYIRFRYVYRVPLAILATGITVLAALSLVCGFVLDTIVRYEREQFFLRMRDFAATSAAGEKEHVHPTR